jgi:hypothetical protein
VGAGALDLLRRSSKEQLIDQQVTGLGGHRAEQNDQPNAPEHQGRY